MMYPLVRELAAADAPHRVLGLARQPYYRWLACPVTDSELAEVYRGSDVFRWPGTMRERSMADSTL